MMWAHDNEGKDGRRFHQAKIRKQQDLQGRQQRNGRVGRVWQTHIVRNIAIFASLRLCVFTKKILLFSAKRLEVVVPVRNSKGGSDYWTKVGWIEPLD
jgi:hypothetical protein